MKKNRILSLLLVITLFAGIALPGIHIVYAADAQYEKLVEWTFDGNDEYSAAWSKGGYTASGLTPVYSITGGKLQVEEDYTPSSNATYNRIMALYSFGSGSDQKDLSEAVKLSFTFYSRTGDELPSQFIAVYTGKLEGAGSNTTVSETWKFSNVATKEDNSDLEGFDRYTVSVPLGESTKEQRGYITRWQLGEIRTNNTYQGTVYYDDIVFWRERENAPAVTLDKTAAVQGQNITATAVNIQGTIAWQWYIAPSLDLSEAQPISNAVSAEYVPELKQAGGWIYCVADNGAAQVQSPAVRVAAAQDLVETPVPFSQTTVNQNDQYFLTNTKAYSGKFDAAKLVSGGYFLVHYSGTAKAPQFQWATWSSVTGKKTVQVDPCQTGDNGDGTLWAKYSYEDLTSAWSDEDFSELKALRLYYKADDSANLVVNSVSWFGMPMSYGELGESVSLKGSYSSYHYLFTRHVGGSFDAARIREDSFFYVEYQGSENALNMVLQSHSNEHSTYVTVSASEYGETGAGYYSIFSAKTLAEAFGDKLRYVDCIRLTIAADKSLTASASMYFFEGTGALLDDISADGYSDTIDVPWRKYDHTDKSGIAVIGASITQNPLVTAAALSGAPYYAPNGGWNAILDRTDVVTYGIGSQTTVNVAERFDEVLRYNYDTIIIQCGNNDLGASSDESVVIAQEVASYTTMFEKVKAKNAERTAQGLGPIQVYVIAINPTNSEGYSNTMQGRIEHVVDALAKLSEEYEFVTYIRELYEAFKNRDEEGNYITGSPNDPDCPEVHVHPNLVMADGLHPVAEGYALYAKFLKPLLASSDPADTRLVSLSYRMSQTQKKTPVAGFETLKTADSYEVLLPAGTAADSQVQLYVTAANLSSTVLVNGNAVASDEYGNDQITLTLVGGEATAAVEVTAPNGTKKVYNVIFHVNTDATVFESEDSYEITVTDGTVDSWPYVQVPVSISQVNPGTTVEFDLAVDNLEFTKMYLETDLDWVMMGSRNMKQEDLVDNVAHITMVYVGTSPVAIGNIQIKTGGSDITDFRGTLTISDLKIINDLTYVDEDPSDDPIPDRPLVHTVLSETQASGEGAWTLIQTVQTSNANGTFDASSISKDGYFTVTYTGTEGAVYLALAEWTTGAWISVNTPASTTVTEDGSFVSTFAFDDLQTALNVFNTSNSADVKFEDIDAISVGSANAEGTTVVTEISWYGYPTVIELGETQMLFEGSKTASVPGTNLTFLYTSHVGGS